ncbi:MAG: hypothetical protein KIT09_17070 [Bryobacteraceae bacterium]|nr:hypothetical protein [Bryobacteraceae bacterium]
MPSATDFHNELKGANARLDGVNGRLDDVKGKLDALKAATDAVRASVDSVNGTLQQGFKTLITLGVYTNQALFHNSQQNDTMICMLEQISRNTCHLVNQSYLQTELQTAIKKATETLAALYAATHAEAALAREREEALREQIEKCCPPKPPEPVCRYERCRAPEPLREPPRVEERPIG